VSFAFQVAEPESRRQSSLFVIPVSLESIRKVLTPKFLAAAIHDAKYRAIKAAELGARMLGPHGRSEVANNAKDDAERGY
jgi:hypothetical protein